MTSKQFTFIDLFSGIGGFKMALKANGGKCLAFSEINKDAINAYCDNYHISSKYNLGDITQITQLPKHDLLTAGVPCQSWSIAGKNLGFDDDRGQLWNDTIFLLSQSKPKAFIFENVKGLTDPRNKEALTYILDRIRQAGYYANYHLINSHDYGVAQNRVRVYIIGFREEYFFKRFRLPEPITKKKKLADILGIEILKSHQKSQPVQQDLFGNPTMNKQMSLSSTNGFNDYFLFNDLRNGHSTIHSWDIIDTTEKQKSICLILLRNRRKKQFGPLDGNPLSLSHFQQLNSSISLKDLDALVELDILKKINYRFEIINFDKGKLVENEKSLLNFAKNNFLVIDELKTERSLKIKKVPIIDTVQSMLDKHILKCVEERFDFKNTKISSGLNGVNRIFMPTSDMFPTLVASDTNDYISLVDIEKPSNHEDYREQFLEKVYFTNNYRKITKKEACLIQGFPCDFKLPESRAKWMMLIGNSVSVPVIDTIIKSVIQTGIFDDSAIEKGEKSQKIKTSYMLSPTFY